LYSVVFLILHRDEAYDILAVTDWAQALSFYQLSGKQVRCMNYPCLLTFASLIGYNPRWLSINQKLSVNFLKFWGGQVLGEEKVDYIVGELNRL